MNIDLPDHVVFKTEMDGESKELCLDCAIKLLITRNGAKIKALCSAGEFDKCECCDMYLS